MRRVARVGGDALDRVQHNHGELRARLILLQVERDQRHSGVGAAAVPGTRLVQHVRERVLPAAGAGAHSRHLRHQIIVDPDDGVLEEIFHPAIGNAAPRGDDGTGEGRAVVPVSSTVT